MIKEELKRVMEELERSDFQTLLDYASHHAEAEDKTVKQSYFNVELYFEWHSFPKENANLQPKEILPWIKSQIGTHERQLLLSRILIYPGIVTDDGETVSLDKVAYISYKADIEPKWQELRFQVKTGTSVIREATLKRCNLHIGQTILNEEESPLGRIIVTDLESPQLARWDGDSTYLNVYQPRLKELFRHKEESRSLQQSIASAFTTFHAGVFFDKKEWQPTWQGLYFYEIEQDGSKRNYYTSHNEIEAGRVILNFSWLPHVKVTSTADDHISVQILKQKEEHELWIGETVELTKNLSVMLTGREIPQKKSIDVNSDPMPTEWEVTAEWYPKTPLGTDLSTLKPEATITKRMMETETRFEFEESADGTRWEKLSICGCLEGKLLIGDLSRHQTPYRRQYMGMIKAGETLELETLERTWDDDTPDEMKKRCTIRIRCEAKEPLKTIVKDGVMESAANDETVVVPDGVEKIHYQALLTATRMRRISLPASIKDAEGAVSHYRYENHRPDIDCEYRGTWKQWIESGVGAMEGQCKSFIVDGIDVLKIENLVVQDVSSIGNRTFKELENLKTVVIHESVTRIGEEAFYGCKNLKEVRVLGPAAIEREAFWGCKQMTKVYLADGVSELKDGCFDYCENLDEVFIPKTVTKVTGHLSDQNGPEYRYPTFRCEHEKQPEGWPQNWHEYYYDSRFGHIEGHIWRHIVVWGCKRDDE